MPRPPGPSTSAGGTSRPWRRRNYSWRNCADSSGGDVKRERLLDHVISRTRSSQQVEVVAAPRIPHYSPWMTASRWSALVPQRLRGLFQWRGVASLPALLADNAALDFRIVGRTLLHAAAVGVAAGFAGAALFAGLELFQRMLLEGL